MPLSPEAERSFQEIRRWEERHPGHCGRCCLPFEHCYHHDSNFRATVRRVNHSASEYGSATMEWHTRVLKVMSTEALQALPEPRRPTKQVALIEELNRRRDHETNLAALERLRAFWPSRYELLMADKDLV